LVWTSLWVVRKQPDKLLPVQSLAMLGGGVFGELVWVDRDHSPPIHQHLNGFVTCSVKEDLPIDHRQLVERRRDWLRRESMLQLRGDQQKMQGRQRATDGALVSVWEVEGITT
jgi:hypothetical protein